MAQTKKQWKALYREQIKMGTCYCYLCGKPIETEKEFNLDHSIPLSRGGQNEACNWRPTHRTCNNDKGALTYSEWMLYQELLRKKHGHVK